jgi:hypothetical protein
MYLEYLFNKLYLEYLYNKLYLKKPLKLASKYFYKINLYLI